MNRLRHRTRHRIQDPLRRAARHAEDAGPQSVVSDPRGTLGVEQKRFVLGGRG